MRGVGRVYDFERQQAIRQYMDAEYAVRIGMAAALSISRRALAEVVKAFRTGRSVGLAAQRSLRELDSLLTDAMVYARLRGYERAVKEAASGNGALRLALGEAYKRAIAFVRNRVLLPVSVIDDIEEKMNAHALRVLKEATPEIEKKLEETVALIHAKNLHVKAGVAELRKAWGDLGLTQSNRYQLEGLFRTQTQLAYAAGQEDYESQPEIQEVLWGYKYITAGDDRVRPEHMAIDGVTLPKEHQFWRKNRPPNGWSCRCQLIPLYRPRKEVEPPETVSILKKDRKTGETRWINLKPGAEEGFRISPGELLGRMKIAAARMPPF